MPSNAASIFSPLERKLAARFKGGSTMKKLLIGALLGACCAGVHAQTAQELLADAKNTDDVLTFGMGYDLKMWSPLKQIDKSNIKRLVPVWSFSLSNDMGELSQPTVY